jgi:hypothetical protein
LRSEAPQRAQVTRPWLPVTLAGALVLLTSERPHIVFQPSRW